METNSLYRDILELFGQVEKKETTLSIADIFSQFVRAKNEIFVMFLQMKRFLVYVEYCSKQSRSIQIAKKLKQENSDYSQFHKVIYVLIESQSFQTLRVNSLSRSLSLGDFLIKPVQRITKYPLLLQVLFISSL